MNPKQELSTGPDPNQHLRGIFATEGIEEGEMILSVPWSLTIHPGSPGIVPFNELDAPGISVSCMSVEVGAGVASYFALLSCHHFNLSANPVLPGTPP